MTTATQRQVRRGTTSQINAKTPAAGEVWFDTTLKRLVVGDGSTTGGIPVPYLSSLVLNGLNSIKFPATQVASSDVNTLDDYEEGTFTPSVQFGGGTTGITYTSQAGSYTKIGNALLFSFKFVLSNKGTATGTAAITGLPFSMSSTPASNASPFSIAASAMNSSLSAPLSAYLNSGNSTISLVKFASGNITNLADTDFANTSQMWIAGHYRTA